MSKTCVIISGGFISPKFADQTIQDLQPDFIIGADRGLEYLAKSPYQPTHIVGDFDSLDASVLEIYQTRSEIPIHRYNPVKDATDTEIAIRLAIELGAKKLWILGATGTRVDHLLANIQCLAIAESAGVSAYICDEYNRIQLIESGYCMDKQSAYGTFFSLFPLGSEVMGLSVEGAKYPLANHTLGFRDSLGVSNQMEADKVVISYEEGQLILIESRDEI